MMFVLFLAGFVTLIRYLTSIMPSDVGCTQQHNGMEFIKATITNYPNQADTLSCLYRDNTTVTTQYDELDPNGPFWHNSGPNRSSCDGTAAESTETDASKCHATPGYGPDDADD